MIRYYISPRLGTGVPGSDPYRSSFCKFCDDQALSGDESHRQGLLKSVIGVTSTWCIDKADYTVPQNVAILSGVAGCVSFPEIALDSVLNVPVRNLVSTNLNSFGIDTSWITSTSTLRDIIYALTDSMLLSELTQIFGRLDNVSAVNYMPGAALGDFTNLEKLRILERFESAGVDTSWVVDATNLKSLVDNIRENNPSLLFGD